MTGTDLTKLINKKQSEILQEKLSFKFNTAAFLQALAVNESSYGTNNKPRFEKAFYVDGEVYNKSQEVRKLVIKYGKSAAYSYSSWQILYITAFELGFTDSPAQLTNDLVAIDWVIKFINKRIISKNPIKLDQMFSAYNSGLLVPPNSMVQAYVTKGMNEYFHFTDQ